MADPNNDGEENTTPPPTEEERHTETVDDEVKPKEDSEPEPSQPDVSARLDSIEKELAALKAMMTRSATMTSPRPTMITTAMAMAIPSKICSTKIVRR